MSGWLRRIRESGAESAGFPARPTLGWMARAGTGATAAAGVVLVSCLFTPASSAPYAMAGDSPTGGTPAVEWAAFASEPAQPLKRIRWRAKVDLHPIVIQGQLTTNYASPMITAANTVLVPTRVSAKSGYRVVAYSGTSGARRWSLDTDYRSPVVPSPPAPTISLPAVLTPSTALAVAGAGGTVLVRKHANLKTGAVRRRVFYGAAQWKAHRSVYDKAVQITTPLTAGPDGSVYFGFTVKGATPAHLSSGIARIDAHGHATWITAAAAAGNPAFAAVAIECAPALSPTGKTLYITVTGPPIGPLPGELSGILVGLNATTLKPRFHVVLKDPVTGLPAMILTGSTASPTVGPDGDVYYGVLGNQYLSHDGRGWLLHYNATLTRTKIPGSFGWDNTVSVLPARAVPGYHGTSPYLLVSKYNNYYGAPPYGNGHNEVAELDTRSSQKHPGREDPPQRPATRAVHPHHHRSRRHRLRHQQGHPLRHRTLAAAHGKVCL